LVEIVGIDFTCDDLVTWAARALTTSELPAFIERLVYAAKQVVFEVLLLLAVI